MFRESWRPVVGYEKYYQVSDMGRVFGRIGRILKPQMDDGGYLRVSLSVNGKVKSRTIHSLVLEAFIGPRGENCEGCHVDHDKQNNTLANLMWATHKENVIQSLTAGRLTFCEGEKHTKAKTTEEDVIKMRELYSQGLSIKEIHSQFTNVSKPNVWTICNKKTWKHI